MNRLNTTPIKTGKFHGAFIGPLMVNMISAILQPLAWPIIMVAASIFCFWLATRRKAIASIEQESNPSEVTQSGRDDAPQDRFVLPQKAVKAVFVAGVLLMLGSLTTGILACRNGNSMSQPAVDWIAARFDRLDEGQDQIQKDLESHQNSIAEIEKAVNRIAESLLEKAEATDRSNPSTIGTGPRKKLNDALLRYAEAAEASGDDSLALLEELLEGNTQGLIDYLDLEIQSGKGDLYTLHRERAIVAYIHGDKDKALESARVAAALQPDGAQEQLLYGTLLMESGDLGAALSALRQAKALYEADANETTPSLVDTSMHIGFTYLLQKKPREALEAFREAERVARRVYSDDHEAVSRALKHAGRSLEMLEEYNDALEAYRQAELILTEVHSDQHPDVVELRHSIAAVYEQIGFASERNEDYKKAMAAFRQAESIYRNLYGDIHQNVSEAVESIAYIFDATDRFTESLERYREVEIIYRKLYGDQDARVAKTLVEIGQVLRWSGDLEGAVKAFREAEAIWLKTAPADPRDLEKLRENMTAVEQELDSE